MIVRSMRDRDLSDDYGIGFQLVYPAAGEDAADWGFGRAVVPPSTSTHPHAHTEHEAFLIVSGRGRMRVGAEERSVESGEVVVIPGGSEHELTNTSTERTLVFIDVYWPARHGGPDL